MINIELKEEYAEDVFEILCDIPFEAATMEDSEPPTTRHPGIEDILTQLQRFVLDDEMEPLAGEYDEELEQELLPFGEWP